MEYSSKLFWTISEGDACKDATNKVIVLNCSVVSVAACWIHSKAEIVLHPSTSAAALPNQGISINAEHGQRKLTHIVCMWEKITLDNIQTLFLQYFPQMYEKKDFFKFEQFKENKYFDILL